MCVVVYVLFPYCQYYIDPDSVAYLTIAKRYANGETLKAVNGLWSPWSCWLVAVLLKQGMAAMSAAVLVNACGAVGVLYICQSLFLHYNLERKLQWMLHIALAIFLSYSVYSQLFEDLWECFLLLSTFRVMASDRYSTRPLLWVAGGIIAAVAYFAKAYSFPFFILNTVCCTFFLTNAIQKENRKQWIKICFVTILVMVLCSGPWLYLLHEKYGKWMASTSGSMNTSISLVGHAIWKDGIHHLIPPTYADSPYYWEDPYPLIGNMPHFWDSMHLFLLQIVRVGQRTLQMIVSMNEISSLLLPTWILALCIVLSKKVRSHFPESYFLLALTMMLFPSGFFLAHFEARYIYYMIPLSMILGVWILGKAIAYTDNKWLSGILPIVFCLTYICWPVWDMKNMLHEGKEQLEVAGELQQARVTGSFASNETVNKDVQKVARIAYYSGNPYYNMETADFSHTELLEEMRKYKVKYYFYFHPEIDSTNYIFLDEQGKALPEVMNSHITGLKVILVTP